MFSSVHIKPLYIRFSFFFIKLLKVILNFLSKGRIIKMREQSEGNIHQTKRQYEKYVVSEMLSKLGLENREPNSESKLC